MRLKLALALLASASVCVAVSRSLVFYFIDVEGGQSTLLVTPDKQSYLIDTGWAGNEARDANRIVAAAHDAGVAQIDYLMITHFHPDHDGGVVELSKRMPIRYFVDHDTGAAEAQMDAGIYAAYQSYLEVR